MNFLDAYLIYASGNEAPPIFHKWAGISSLSCLVSRRVWVPQGIFTVYPNLYIIFVGNPGNGKSTAMKIARDLVRAFPKESPIAPASITREALTQDLGDEDGPHKLFFTHPFTKKQVQYSHISVFANEIVTLLGTNPIGMVEFFTDIWDEDEFKVKTKNKGTDIIPNPCVTLCGCMTPEITSNLLKENIISGGFARRCVFVYANKRGAAVPRPTITPEQLAAREFCVQWGKQLVTLTGEFTWTDEAKEVFDTWYIENHEFVNRNTDLLLNGYYTTKSNMVIKVAMLLGLADTTELVLRPQYILEALNLLAKTEVHLHKVFAGTGRNPESAIAAKIMTMLESSGNCVNEKQVYARMYDHGNAEEIRAALTYLLNDNRIKVLEYQPRPGQPLVRMVGVPDSVTRFALSLKSTLPPDASPLG